MNQWWSWILAAIGVSGIYVVGNKNMLGKKHKQSVKDKLSFLGKKNMKVG